MPKGAYPRARTAMSIMTGERDIFLAPLRDPLFRAMTRRSG